MYMGRHRCQNSLNNLENKNKVKENLSDIKVYIQPLRKVLTEGWPHKSMEQTRELRNVSTQICPNDC